MSDYKYRILARTRGEWDSIGHGYDTLAAVEADIEWHMATATEIHLKNRDNYSITLYKDSLNARLGG